MQAVACVASAAGIGSCIATAAACATRLTTLLRTRCGSRGLGCQGEGGEESFIPPVWDDRRGTVCLHVSQVDSVSVSLPNVDQQVMALCIFDYSHLRSLSISSPFLCFPCAVTVRRSCHGYVAVRGLLSFLQFVSYLPSACISPAYLPTLLYYTLSFFNAFSSLYSL